MTDDCGSYQSSESISLWAYKALALWQPQSRVLVTTLFASELAVVKFLTYCDVAQLKISLSVMLPARLNLPIKLLTESSEISVLLHTWGGELIP